jgi:hypothetical protein
VSTQMARTKVLKMFARACGNWDEEKGSGAEDDGVPEVPRPLHDDVRRATTSAAGRAP